LSLWRKDQARRISLPQEKEKMTIPQTDFVREKVR
jgi:hypothetical protein